MLRYGYFDDERREYVITTPGHAVPVDQLPRHRQLLRHRLEHGGRLLLLPRRPAAPAHPVPLQQRADRRGRPLPLRPDDGRRVLVAVVAAHAGRLDAFECRHGLVHDDQPAQAGRRVEHAATSCRGATPPRSGGSPSRTTATPGRAVSLLLGRVLPVERLRRHDQLPAQLQHRRGRGRRRARSITRPSTASGATTSPSSPARARWPGSTPTGRPSSASTGDSTSPLGGRARRARATRSRTAGRRTARTTSGSPWQPGEEKTSSSCSATWRTRATTSGSSPGVINKARAGRSSTALDPQTVRDGARGAPRPLGTTCSAYQVADTPTRSQPDGQHLEPLPVHGDVQHVPLSSSYFETGHRPRHGVPRLEPGSARASCTSCPERARERIIDIASTQFAGGSAYHQYQPLTKRGNNDVGCGFNDDPLWLIFGVAAYIKETGDFAILDEQVPFDNDPSEATALRAPASAPSTTRSTGSARTACRSSAAPTGTTA